MSVASILAGSAGFAQGDSGAMRAMGMSTPPTRAQIRRVNAQDEFGMTPLHWAVMEGLTDEVSTLLARGANPNVQDAMGMTPLHYAAQHGRTDIAALLLQRMTKPDLKDEDDMGAMQWAAIGGHQDFIDLMLQK